MCLGLRSFTSLRLIDCVQFYCRRFCFLFSFLFLGSFGLHRQRLTHCVLADRSRVSTCPLDLQANGTGGCKHSQAKKLGDVTTLNLTMLKAGVTGDGGETWNLNCIPARCLFAGPTRALCLFAVFVVAPCATPVNPCPTPLPHPQSFCAERDWCTLTD